MPAEIDVYNTPNTGVNTVDHVSAYVQDSWTPTARLTLNLGARFDRYAMGWPAQSIAPTHADIWAPRTVAARSVLSWANVGPRVGAAFDVTGRGRTVVKAFAGRFYWNPSTTIVDDENPVGQAAARFVFDDLNGNGRLDPGPSGGLADSPELGRRLATLGGAGTVSVDPGLTSPHGHEVSAHFEQQLAADLSVRASYVYKNTRNLYGIVDVNRAFAYQVPFEYHDRGPDDVAGTADDQTLHLLDRLPDVPEDRRYVNPGRHGLLPPDGDYHTVEVALNRRFSRRWMFLTSFLHTWAEAPMRTTSSTSVRTDGPVRLHRRHDLRVAGQPGAEARAGLHNLLELQAGRPVRLPPQCGPERRLPAAERVPGRPAGHRAVAERRHRPGNGDPLRRPCAERRHLRRPRGEGGPSPHRRPAHAHARRFQPVQRRRGAELPDDLGAPLQRDRGDSEPEGLPRRPAPGVLAAGGSTVAWCTSGISSRPTS